MPERIERPSGLTYRFEHDASGRLATLTYPSGRRLEFGRDEAGDITALRQPDFAEYGFDYAKSGVDKTVLQAVTYPDQRRQSFEYDGGGRVTAIIEPSGARYEYLRDEQGIVTEIVDPLGQSVQLLTDDTGALQAVALPDASFETFHFDPARGTAVRTHRDGIEIRYPINNERIARIDCGPDDSTRFEYDSSDNLAAVERNGQMIAFRIEEREIIEEKTAAGSVSYTREPKGSPLALQTLFGDRIRYRYGEDGRLTPWDSREVQFAYGAEDTITEIRFPN